LATLLLGVVCGLLAWGRTWASGVPAADLAGLGRSLVVAAGTEVAPSYGPLLLVTGGAALVATFVGGRARRLVLAAGLLAAVGAIGAAAWGLAHLAEVLATLTVPPGRPVEGAGAAFGVYLGLFGAALAVLGACLALAGALRWPAPSRRQERPAGTDDGTPGPAGREPGSHDWDALSRGEDPTL